MVSSSSKCKKGEKRERRNRGVANWFLERRFDFSLKYRVIRPSAVVGTRSKVALRIEAYAWVPVL